MRRFTVDLDSIRHKNMYANMHYKWMYRLYSKRTNVTRHISESPYDELFKNKRNVFRANRTLTGIRFVMRWNKEKTKC